MIIYHHIGGRNGSYPFPLKKGPLLKHFHLVLYDADAHCFDTMKTKEHEAWGEVSIYPYCIGERKETGTFYLNFHPTTNSLYPFNEVYKDYNFVKNPIYGEYRLGDACKKIHSMQIDLLSLEDALTVSHIPKMDFLSLDVQGAEYDVLNGAKRLLQQDCIAVQLEVEFAKIYHGQKTFTEIHAFMENLGFELLELDGFGRCAPISLPIGFRGLEQPIYAEAVYIKSADKLMEENDFEKLCKAALFSLIYKKLGLCFKLLDKAFEDYTFPQPIPLYIQFLSEIYRLFKEAQHLKFPKLSELFTHDKFQMFYGTHDNVQDKREDDSTKMALKTLLPEVQSIGELQVSPLEEVLKIYGLDAVAEVVKRTRLFETHCFMELMKNPEIAIKVGA